MSIKFKLTWLALALVLFLGSICAQGQSLEWTLLGPWKQSLYFSNMNCGDSTFSSPYLERCNNDYVIVDSITGGDHTDYDHLFADHSGTLYQLTDDGYVYNDGEKWQIIPRDTTYGKAFGQINEVLHATNGKVYLTSIDSGVIVFDGMKFEMFNSSNGLGMNRVYGLHEGASGKIYAAGGGGYSVLEGDVWTHFNWADLKLPEVAVTDVYEKDDTLIMAQGEHISWVTSDTTISVDIAEYGLYYGSVTKRFTDDGDLLMLLNNLLTSGYKRLSNHKIINHYYGDEGFFSDIIQDQNGDVFIAGASGIRVMKQDTTLIFTSKDLGYPDELADRYPFRFYESIDGRLFASGLRYTFEWKADHWEFATDLLGSDPTFSFRPVNAVYNHNNALYVSGVDMRGHGILAKFWEGKWEPVQGFTHNGQDDDISKMLIARNGDLLLGTKSSGFAVLSQTEWSYHVEVLNSPVITDIDQLSDGTIVVATNAGINFYNGLNWTSIESSEEGLVEDSVIKITVLAGDSLLIKTESEEQLYYQGEWLKGGVQSLPSWYIDAQSLRHGGTIAIVDQNDEYLAFRESDLAGWESLHNENWPILNEGSVDRIAQSYGYDMAFYHSNGYVSGDDAKISIAHDLLDLDTNNIVIRLFYDKNRNGTLDQNETGAAGQIVHLNAGARTATTIESGRCFMNLPLGNYTLDVDLLEGWSILDSTQLAFTVAGSNTETVYVALNKVNRITGHVYFDFGNDGEIETKKGLAGQQLILQPGNYSTTTNSNGSYEIEVPSGKYDLYYNPKGEWTATVNKYAVAVDLDYSESIVVDFAAHKTVEIIGRTYFDQNQNGAFDAGEITIGGRTVELQPFQLFVTSESNGEYSIPVDPGFYIVQPEAETGWSPTGNNQGQLLMVDTSSVTNIDVGFYSAYNVLGRVFNDINGDGLKATYEPWMDSLTINLGDTHTTLTDSSGYFFSSLALGNHKISIANGQLYSITTDSSILELSLSGSSPIVADILIGVQSQSDSIVFGQVIESDWEYHRADTVYLLITDSSCLNSVDEDCYNGYRVSYSNVINLHDASPISHTAEGAIQLFSDTSLYVFEFGQWTQFKAKGSYIGDSIILAQGRDDSYFVVITELGLLEYRGHKWSDWLLPFESKNFPVSNVNSILQALGTVWIGSDSGLYRPGQSRPYGPDWEWLEYPLNDLGEVNDDVFLLNVEGDGSNAFWFRLEHGGLMRTTIFKYEYFTHQSHGLPGNRPTSVTVIGNGATYATFDRDQYGEGGLARRINNDSPWEITYAINANGDTLTGPLYYSIETAVGDVWLGGENGVATMRNGEWSIYNAKTAEFKNYHVNHLFEGADGRVYVSTNDGYVVFEGDQYTIHCSQNSWVQPGQVTRVDQDFEGNLYVWTEKGFAMTANSNLITDVETSSNGALTASPNYTLRFIQDELILNPLAGATISKIWITNMLGQTVQSRWQQSHLGGTTSTNGLPKGTYIVNILSAKGKVTSIKFNIR